MRQGSHSKRHRGRSNGRRSHGLASNYESNGPDVKIKGSAAHVQERYEGLGREAVVSGDRVAAEGYLQHAEHYQRIITAQLATQAETNAAKARGRDNHRDGNRTETEAPAETPLAETASDEAVVSASARDDKSNATSEAKPERSGRRRGRSRGTASAQPRDDGDSSPPESAAV
jgi:hypothetical protein